MKVVVTPKTESSQAELEITVPAETFKPHIDRVITELSQDVSLKGFRPGKAPRDLAIAHIGHDRIMQEAMNSALPIFFARAAIDEDVQAVSRPSISVHEIGMDSPLRFTAVVEVVPSITLADPKKLKTKKRAVEVKAEQVEQELTRIAKMRSTYTEVARDAKDGDMVTIDFTVRIDGNVIEGGESKDHPVTLGEGRFVPGFEDALIGTKAGDDKTFSITFPNDYGKKDIAGKEAEVTAHVHNVQERVVPAIDDAFAASIGSFKTLQDLKDQLKKNIAEEESTHEEERYLSELAEELMTNSTFGVIPQSLIEHEIDRRVEEFANMLAYQQKTIEDYYAEHDSNLQKMRDGMKESAEKHVKIGLALREFAKQHDVEVTPEEITEEANKQLAQFKSTQQAQEEIDPHDLREYVESMLKNKKTLTLLSSLSGK